MLTVGALCAGYGGLELGLSLAGIPATTAWVSETEPNASTVLSARHPHAPNLGDLTTITDVPPVDIVTAGFPCQPVSQAGLQKGIHDDRWLIEDVCRVARSAGAGMLVLENVRRILTANGGAAMQHVCQAMADQGFSRWEWTTLRASDVGAPHRRDRWFCVAYADDIRCERAGEARRRGAGPAHHGAAAAHPDGQRLEERRLPEGQGHDNVPDPARGDRFGAYWPAVQRWELIIGRPAPGPLAEGKLSPHFVEWMMGLPAGWVTDVIDNRRSALRILGNGVVPQQAAAAILQLKEHVS